MTDQKQICGEGRTLAEMRSKLLADGVVSEKSLAKAHAELVSNPEWLKYLAQQPSKASAELLA